MPAADPGRVIASARAWLGTPFHHQASLQTVGCDCLGLIRGVWRDVVGREAFDIPAYAPDWSARASHDLLRAGLVAHLLSIPGPAASGDVILFRMRGRMITSHAGILVDTTTLIHAHSRLGVIEERLTPVWRARAAHVFRYPR